MEVTQFVDESSIDPEFFEKPYFVVPENEAQTEAFLTVRKALIDTKKVALSKIAFAGREHVVAIAPAGTDQHGGLMVYTLRYAAELRDPAAYFRDVKKMTIAADSLSLAKELIKRKSSAFDPTKFTDGYEAAVKELVDAKLKHAPIPREEAPVRTRAKVIHLMDALRKSVNDTKSTAPKSTATKSLGTSATTKPASRKGPTLIKSATKPHPQRATKSTRTSPRRKTA
jgi:DNA end-binding protein Ku